MMILVLSQTGQVEFRPPPAVHDPYLAAPTVCPHIPYRSSAQEPLTEFSGPVRQLGEDFFEQMVGVVQPDSSYSTHGYTARDYGILSSEPFMGRQSADLRFEGNRGFGEEPDMDAGDEEQPVPLAHVAPTSGSDGWPHNDKGKGLTGSFMLIMSKILGSRNKRPDKARDVPAPT
ncbi:hypothetical protein M9H77_35078 [Catharanthus roseus]|uniref:Uncharacterized protein n=1 Tax=Catharanthus roseus TaxID=4058 RepID=A0ACB9ZPV9_CATRO|nr:hypothetical protein M9H77_35078 [Catharanthus roseus]